MIDVFDEDTDFFCPFDSNDPEGEESQGEEVIYTSNDCLYTILKFMIKGTPLGFSHIFASYVKAHEDEFIGIDASGNITYNDRSPLAIILSNLVLIIDIFPPCKTASIAANRFINLIDSLKATFNDDIFDSFLTSKTVNRRLQKINSVKNTLTEEEILNEFLIKVGGLHEIDFSKEEITFDLSEGFIRLNFLDPNREYYSYNFN